MHAIAKGEFGVGCTLFVLYAQNSIKTRLIDLILLGIKINDEHVHFMLQKEFPDI